MKSLKSTYTFLKEKYLLLQLKKYTTLAGTLVFFFIMSIIPLTFLLTLLIGKLPIDLEQIFDLQVFESVKNVLVYIKEEAENATTGASLILILTTLYSATNLFYQMRKSGEIIYGYSRRKRGFRVRMGALVLLLIVLAMVIAFLLVYAVGTFLFSKFLQGVLEKVSEYLLLIGIAFLLVLLLNVYVCPYKEKIRRFLPGSMLTVIAWACAIIGFSIYLKIGNPGRLYGALSAIIVFLLWLYMLMICFIAGVIFNSENITKEREKANKRRREKNKISE